MSQEPLLGSILAIVIVLAAGSFYHFWRVPKEQKINNLSKFRRDLFELQKDFFFLTQKKSLHDEKVTDFVSELEVPEGRGITAKKVNLVLDKHEATFKHLLSREDFFLACKKRVLEVIKELEALNSKSLRASLKLIDKKANENCLTEELKDLKNQTEELKDNKNLLIHSFSSFQEEARKKLLSFKKVS